jgi:hypothetical protein
MFWSVPLVWKLASTSVPASTFPVPVTDEVTTPRVAVTTSVAVRAAWVGGPSVSTAATTAAASTTISPRMGQGIRMFTQRPPLLARRLPERPPAQSA